MLYAGKYDNYCWLKRKEERKENRKSREEANCSVVTSLKILREILYNNVVRGLKKLMYIRVWNLHEVKVV